MPLFIQSKLFFIHIPKSGGTTIEKFMSSHGDKALFHDSTGVALVNGHSPQHCTFRELLQLNMISDAIEFFTVLRSPLARTVSEFFYLTQYRADIAARFDGFDGFLDIFLDETNSLLFDNHNLSNWDFLRDGSANIDSRIQIVPFFDACKIEKVTRKKGLSSFHEIKTEKMNFTLTQEQETRIRSYFHQDFKNFAF